jgi:hypothetical protein
MSISSLPFTSYQTNRLFSVPTDEKFFSPNVRDRLQSGPGGFYISSSAPLLVLSNLALRLNVMNTTLSVARSRQVYIGLVVEALLIIPLHPDVRTT